MISVVRHYSLYSGFKTTYCIEVLSDNVSVSFYNQESSDDASAVEAFIKIFNKDPDTKEKIPVSEKEVKFKKSK